MKFISTLINRPRIYDSEDAYKLWSMNYDDERDNLMLHYDKIILGKLISKIDLSGKIILDYGCGTGRNWDDLINRNPGKIIGCDISAEMLDKLKAKFNGAAVHLIKENTLSFLTGGGCNVIISTLVIAHIKEINNLFKEWSRVLKSNGDIILTDFHPELLANGGERTFNHNGKSITIRNYIHHVAEIEYMFSSLGFKTAELIEKNIDEEVKIFYEKHNALNVYEKYKGLPFIYGIHLSRRNAD